MYVNYIAIKKKMRYLYKAARVTAWKREYQVLLRRRNGLTWTLWAATV